MMKYLINTITSWDESPRARHRVAQAFAKLHKKNSDLLLIIGGNDNTEYAEQVKK